MTADDLRHGTQNGYTNLGCRCDECRAANTRYHADYRWRTGRSEPAEVVNMRRALDAELRDNHGTESRYRFGCRCVECREAHRVGRAGRRARAKVAA